MEKKKNILWFAADQMRCDSLHHMGNEASVTPNLDKLSQEGVSFKNAYCQNPVCVPSRCSFLTGLYPHTTGHRTMHFMQGPDEPNVLRVMKHKGYEVVWIGRNDVVPSDRDKSDYCDIYYDGITMEDKSHAVNLSMKADNISYEIPEFMKKDNYYSFYMGKLDKEEARQGQDWICVDSLLAYLEEKQRRTDSKPFFIYCSIFFPHPPYGCEEPWFGSIDKNALMPRRPSVMSLKDKPSMLYGISAKQNLQNWSEEQFNELRATYLAMVSRFDYHFGLVSDKLKEVGMYDDTNIFVFSDHGDYTGDYGIVEKVQNCFEDTVSRVPLLVKPAKQFKVKPGNSEALVELADLPATIADMAGVELGYVQFGKSLVSAIGGNPVHKDAVFCEGGRIHGEVQAMERGHGPESPYWPRLATQCEEGPEHTKAAMIRMGNIKYTMRLYEKDELYDLDKDPLELNNCIDDEYYKNIVNNMKLRLLQFFMETGDWVPNRKDKR